MEIRKSLVIASLILFATFAYINFALNRSEAMVPREPLRTFPKYFDKWEGKDETLSIPTLKLLNVDEYMMRRFTKGRESIWLYIGYYRAQKEGAVPHSPKHCYPGSGYISVRNSVIEIPVRYGTRSSIQPNLHVFARGTEREVVIYWYQSRGRVIADEYWEKAYLILDSIFRNRSDGALVRFSISTNAANEESATQTLTRFVSEIYSKIPRVVPD